MAENNGKAANASPCCMESVNRIIKLPVVECSIQTATNVYEKVKDLNSCTKWSLTTMENTLHTVVETGKPYAVPVVQKLDAQIKKVDSVLCTGLDYVESKVPAVKLPPSEFLFQIYSSTKDYVHDNVSPTVDAAVRTAKKVTDPAVNLAKPTVEAAYKIVEPIVQPAVDKANALKDYGVHKVEEFLHRESSTEHEGSDCNDCKKDN